MEKQFHEIEKKYDLIRITKHDIKRLLLNYRILLEEGKTQDVLMNINELLNSVPESTEISYTDNKMLDAILHTKLPICQENLIALHMQVALDPRYQNMDYMIVSKHNGMIDIYEKDHMFCVHTIFPRAISH